MQNLHQFCRFLAIVAAVFICLFLIRFTIWNTPPTFLGAIPIETDQEQVCMRRAYLRAMVAQYNPIGGGEKRVLVEECTPDGHKIERGFYPAAAVTAWAGGRAQWESVLIRGGLFVLLPTTLLVLLYTSVFEHFIGAFLSSIKKGGRK